jgi:pimeloyl-ACP methyl ester carboxylesterase
VEDARTILRQVVDGLPLTLVGNSLGGWISWIMAQEYQEVEKLILVAPAFNGMRERANRIPVERKRAWQESGWLPWDDEPGHRDYPISWRWVEESDAMWKSRFERRRPVKTTILHGFQDRAIDPLISWEFCRELLTLDSTYPIELMFKSGDHRLSSSDHLKVLHRLVLRKG